MSIGAVQDMSAGTYFRKLVEMESRGNGDQERAIRKISRDCGLTYWCGYRLYRGETKDPKDSILRRIRLYGLGIAERQLAAAQRNYEEAKRLCHETDDQQLLSEVQILGDQVASFAERVKARKEALK